MSVPDVTTNPVDAIRNEVAPAEIKKEDKQVQVIAQPAIAQTSNTVNKEELAKEVAQIVVAALKEEKKAEVVAAPVQQAAEKAQTVAVQKQISPENQKKADEHAKKEKEAREEATHYTNKAKSYLHGHGKEGKHKAKHKYPKLAKEATQRADKHAALKEHYLKA